MREKAPFLIPIFYLIAAINLIGEAKQHVYMIYGTKPLLMLLLMIYFFVNVKSHFRPFSLLILFALLFSLFGDLSLMVLKEPLFAAYPMFIVGLGSFLIAHLFYIKAFSGYPSTEKGFVRIFPYIAIPFLLYAAWINYAIHPNIGDFFIPVLIYSLVITLMGISALNLSERVITTASASIFIGAILFIFSDTIIALNKFRPDIQIGSPRVLIMLTYILGQYYIVKGAIVANNLIPGKAEKEALQNN